MKNNLESLSNGTLTFSGVTQKDLSMTVKFPQRTEDSTCKANNLNNFTIVKVLDRSIYVG